MDSGDATQLIILLILLLLSAFFSSAETALTTVNKIRIRSLADEGSKCAKTVLEITDNSGKMLSAILIGNNIVNLSAASLTTSLAYSFYGSHSKCGFDGGNSFIRGDHPKNNGHYTCRKDGTDLRSGHPYIYEGYDTCNLYNQRYVHGGIIPSAR